MYDWLVVVRRGPSSAPPLHPVGVLIPDLLVVGLLLFGGCRVDGFGVCISYREGWLVFLVSRFCNFYFPVSLFTSVAVYSRRKVSSR
jgi:hypothetical protein